MPNHKWSKSTIEKPRRECLRCGIEDRHLSSHERFPACLPDGLVGNLERDA